ncbi:hypothetical protein I316_07194 [Kwoniella heveanensis BCC8398]|uniref:Uncharacterized protein n=1 Tax=Kwoniella heveanensis BCC8398 TaxID=1296120 RepID=A0A1B9GJV1_9TREE|nr:hypothetical protein I316_07194 [Kwoniella heveanensis BCC8398]
MASHGYPLDDVEDTSDDDFEYMLQREMTGNPRLMGNSALGILQAVEMLSANPAAAFSAPPATVVAGPSGITHRDEYARFSLARDDGTYVTVARSALNRVTNPQAAVYSCPHPTHSHSSTAPPATYAIPDSSAVTHMTKLRRRDKPVQLEGSTEPFYGHGGERMQISLSTDCKRALKLGPGSRLGCMISSITAGYVQPSSHTFVSEFPAGDDRGTLTIDKKWTAQQCQKNLSAWESSLAEAREEPGMVARKKAIMDGSVFPLKETTDVSKFAGTVAPLGTSSNYDFTSTIGQS